MINCRACGANKPTEDYYKSNLKECKMCVRARVKAHREANLEKIQAYDRERGQTPERKQKNKDYQKNMKENKPDLWRDMRKDACNKYRSNNKHKVNAVQKLERAVATGKIKKKPCIHCGDVNSEAHHPDYQKSLDVIWLCDLHHKEEHKKLREKERQSK